MSSTHRRFRRVSTISLCVTLFALAGKSVAEEAAYYGSTSVKPLFHPHPTDTGRGGERGWLVRNFGPVGIGMNLVRP